MTVSPGYHGETEEFLKELERLYLIEEIAKQISEESDGGIFEVSSWLINDLDKALGKK